MFRHKRRRSLQLKPTFLTLLLICLLFAVFLIKLNRPYDFINGFEILIEETDPNISPALILDTPGCRIQKLDPFDESVRPLISLKEPYVCNGDQVFLITLPNATIVLNDTILSTAYKISPENVHCFYQPIFREKEPEDKIGENYISFGDAKQLQFGVPLGEEFLRVQCTLGTKEYVQFVPLVPIKPEVEKRASESRTEDTDSLNVILIGIDSISKLNFLRHFKKTHQFLVTNMSAFDMKGYTKVADNTFPNLVPLLTGYFIEHYWNETLKDTMFFDNLDFIWNTYASKGYRTFYTEDNPDTGTFNYLKRGFENPPTDYYFRTLGLAMANSNLKNKGSSYCLNDQLETEILYGYLKDFVKTMRNRLHFAFTMVSTMTHDYLNDAGYVDEPTYNLLKDLWEIGAMNKSIVIIFSDHGIRFGAIRETYLGKFEERMPFMYLSLPRWFLEKHESIAKNLKQNQNRLITLFDIHATLHHLLDVTKATGEEFTPNGLSLLGDISEYRTCDEAKILPHWCPCQVYEYASPNDKRVIQAASSVVKEINHRFGPFQNVCAHLEVEEITDARFGQANDLVLRFLEHQNDVVNRHVVYGDRVDTLLDILVTFRARPGGGMFESTVRHDVKKNTFKIMGISRINMYGKQSFCIDSQILKKFCYCI